MKRKIELRRGVYVLPSLFTVSNLFFGFASLVAAQKGNYRLAAVAVFISALLDMLDGRIARMTNTESEFGAELDSIVDVVSFGVAPAFLVYHWGFTGEAVASVAVMRRLGWGAAFLFLTCGALRLARFNVQKYVVDKRYFVGLPIPAGAALIGAMVLRFPDRIDISFFAYIVFAVTVFTALMMVSRIRYRSFKDVNLNRRAPYTVAVVIAVLLIGFLVTPSTVLFIAFSLYLVHPFVTGMLRDRERENTGSADGEETIPPSLSAEK